MNTTKAKLNTLPSSNIIFILSFLVIMTTMNTGIFNVALPALSHDFMLSPSQVSWVVISSSMITAIGSVTYGKLADSIPLKKLFIIGIVLFLIGSILGFSVRIYPIVILSRLLQASGTSSFIALSMIMIMRFFSGHERVKMLGFITGAFALGSGLGPLIGGLIAQYLGWPYLFLLMTLVVIALPFILWLFPSEKGQQKAFDSLGAVLLTAATASLLIGINISAYLLIFAVLFFALLFVQLKRSKEPFIQISLFSNSGYLSLLVVAFFSFTSMTGTFFLLPLMLKANQNMDPLHIGMILFTGPAVGAIISFFSNRLVHIWGSHLLSKLSILVMSLGLFLFYIVNDASPAWLAVFFILFFIGYSCIQASLNNLIGSTLSKQQVGIGMGLYNLISFLGLSVGPAVVSRIYQWSGNFSNNFLLLFCLVLINGLLFILTFKRKDIGAHY
ncbi:MFS transporter [Priestia megaterium]